MTKPSKPIYVTPNSTSILNSITNQSLRELAQQLGWSVEVRDIYWDEIVSGVFSEVAACGTAVVLTMVDEIWKEKEGLPLDQSDIAIITRKDENGVIIESKELNQNNHSHNDVFTLEGLKNTFKAIQRGEYNGWEKLEWMWPSEGI